MSVSYFKVRATEIIPQLYYYVSVYIMYACVYIRVVLFILYFSEIRSKIMTGKRFIRCKKYSSFFLFYCLYKYVLKLITFIRRCYRHIACFSISQKILPITEEPESVIGRPQTYRVSRLEYMLIFFDKTLSRLCENRNSSKCLQKSSQSGF